MPIDHRARAAALREKAGGAAGQTDPALRQSILSRAAGGPALTAPYDALVTHVAEASYRVTDGEVAAVRAATGSDKAAFEVVMTAAIGAALLRFDRATAALEQAEYAPR